MKLNCEKKFIFRSLLCVSCMVLICACKKAADASLSAGISSEHYSLNRVSLGPSFELITSAQGDYRANATLGDTLSSPQTTSESYTITRGLTHKIVIPFVPLEEEE